MWENGQAGVDLNLWSYEVLDRSPFMIFENIKSTNISTEFHSFKPLSSEYFIADERCILGF